jgi:nucleoid DNA-binding protein
MNTPELVKIVAKKLDLTQKDTHLLLKSTTRVFKRTLGEGSGFSVPHLGTFSTHVRDRRRSYLPFYDRMAMLPPKRVVHSQSSSDLEEDVKDLEVKSHE